MRSGLVCCSALQSIASSDRHSRTDELARVSEEQAEMSGAVAGSLSTSSSAAVGTKPAAAVLTPSTPSSTPPSTDAVAPVEDYDTSTLSINTVSSIVCSCRTCGVRGLWRFLHGC